MATRLYLGDGSIDNAGSITLDGAANIFNNFGTNSIHNESDGTIPGRGVSTAAIAVALDNDGTVTTTTGTLISAGARRTAKPKQGAYTPHRARLEISAPALVPGTIDGAWRARCPAR